MSRDSLLQEEIQQTRPFRSVHQEATVGLLRTADMVRERIERIVGPYGITLQQYNVLRILRGARPASLPTMTIAKRMIERAPGITRLLDRLAAKGLVDRARCGEDRRRVLCSISESGLEVLTELDEIVDRYHEEALGGLTEPEARKLVSLLDRIRGGDRVEGGRA